MKIQKKKGVIPETLAEKKEDFFARSQRIVVKVGTSLLTTPQGTLNGEQLAFLVTDLAFLKETGRQVLLVSSGAIGAGVGKLGWQGRPRTLPEKQAAAAVGQGLLMQAYEQLFTAQGLVVAQILLTRGDFADRQRYLNARNTLLTLLRYGVVPVINENDTVAVEEIRFGDNDTLAALVATLVEADLVLLLTDTEGLYTGEPGKDPEAVLIPVVREIDPVLEQLAGEAGSPLSTGGMKTKLAAAKITMSSGIPLVVAGGRGENALRRLWEGKGKGTLFLPQTPGFQARKCWIAFGSLLQGKLYVDAGAAEAILKTGGSLLPSGIKSLSGDFEAGSVVSVIDPEGQEIARGIVNYSAAEIERIKGKKARDMAAILGQVGFDEVIHRDNLAVGFL